MSTIQLICKDNFTTVHVKTQYFISMTGRKPIENILCKQVPRTLIEQKFKMLFVCVLGGWAGMSTNCIPLDRNLGPVAQ